MLKKKREKISLALVTFLLLASIAINSKTVQGSSEKPLIHFDPSTINKSVSTNFVLKLKIDNVNKLYGFDFQMKWDPTIIGYVSHVVKVPVEDYPDGVLHADTMKLKNIIKEADSIPGAEPGTLAWIAYSSMFPAPTFNGSGIAVEFTFTVKSVGKCLIEFVTHDISDDKPTPIAHDIQNAVFDNRPPLKSADIYVDPSSVFDSALTPCHNFSVNINVKNIADLYSFEFWVGYDTTILNATEVTVNPSFPPDHTIVELHEDEGQVRVNATLTSPPGISGNIILATIKFHVEEIGETALDLHDVTLINKYGEVVPHKEPGDGYFNNMLITRMFINPPELIVPGWKPGHIFTIDVQIENGIGMYDYEFNLTYDTSVLTCLGAVIIPPNTDTHFTIEMENNDPQGMLWVKVQYYAPAPPISIYSAQTVTQITFMMQNYGQTPLDLHDTRISNPSGGSMSHEVGDGFFASLLRDVAIVSVKVTSSNRVYAGRIVTIEVIAMNRGNMTSETFNVTAYHDSNTKIGTIRVGPVKPWTNATVIFHWNTTGLAECSNHTIWAEATGVPYETNTANNILHDGWVKIKMVGDVNGDGYIDLYDAVLLLAAYGSRVGDKNWNPECDLCPEWGVINLYDAVMLNYRYGQHCP